MLMILWLIENAAFSLDTKPDASCYAHDWSRKHITWFKRWKCHSSSIVFLFSCHFIVLVGKINILYIDTLWMELKCHRYDVTHIEDRGKTKFFIPTLFSMLFQWQSNVVPFLAHYPLFSIYVLYIVKVVLVLNSCNAVR